MPCLGFVKLKKAVWGNRCYAPFPPMPVVEAECTHVV